MTKAIFGSFVGLVIFLLILLIFHKPIIDRYVYDIKPFMIVNKDSTKMVKVNENTISDEFKINIAILDEKINSLNKRFDDLYILSAVIVTLLLAINIGIFI